MRTIQIEDSTRLRLFQHAKSFDATPDRIINVALDVLENKLNQNNSIQNEVIGVDSKLQFNSNEIPDLIHSNLISAYIAGKTYTPKKWVDLWDPIIRVAQEKGLDTNMLVEQYGLDLTKNPEEKKSPQYYHYVPILDQWIRQITANLTIATVKKISNKFNIKVDIEIYWRNTTKAKHPGQQAKIQIN